MISPRTTITLLSALLLVNAEDHCVFRKKCETDKITSLDKPCVYNGKPLPLEDEEAINFLKDVCPDLKAGSNFAVCCDDGQVKLFKEQLDALAALFKRCPSCYHNLANLFCHLACSPSQSRFLQVTKVTATEAGDSVSELSYFITESFAQGLFDSCKNVKLSFTTAPAISIACGAHMNDCNPYLWLEYMGGNDPSPYQINFKFEKVDKVIDNETVFYPMNATIVPCSEPINPGGEACSCVDCPCHPARHPEP